MHQLVLNSQQQAAQQQQVLTMLIAQQQQYTALEAKFQAFVVSSPAASVSSHPPASPMVNSSSSSSDGASAYAAAGREEEELSQEEPDAAPDEKAAPSVKFRRHARDITFEDEEEEQPPPPPPISDTPRQAPATRHMIDPMLRDHMQSLYRTSEQLAKQLPVFTPGKFPWWRDKSLGFFKSKRCLDVVLGTSASTIYPGVFEAQRNTAWLLLVDSLERGGKARLATKAMQEDPAILWRKLNDTYALAPALDAADTAQDHLRALRQQRGPTSFMTYVETFDERVDVMQEALHAAGRSLIDDPTLIAYVRKGFDEAHQSIALSLLSERSYPRFIQDMSQRSFAAGLSSFKPDHARDRPPGTRRGEQGDNPRAALAATGSTVTCYGCGEDGHI